MACKQGIRRGPVDRHGMPIEDESRRTNDDKMTVSPKVSQIFSKKHYRRSIPMTLISKVMPDRAIHLIKLLFGTRVTEQRVQEICEEVAIYSAMFAEEFVEAMKDEGFEMGHRASSLRREMIAFFAIYALGYSVDDPSRSALVNRFIEKLKAQFDRYEDVGREKFHIDTGDGSSMGGMTEVNLLARTINDRIRFYGQQDTNGVAFKVIIRFAFAAAHVLNGSMLSGKSLQELKQSLKDESGRIARFEYPDENRDEFVTDWLSRATMPIKKQLDDYFYVGEHHRLP